jgi:hypothetical protein
MQDAVLARETIGRAVNERPLTFSRKGFDSVFGGRPSPVLPDGLSALCSARDELESLRHAHDLSPIGAMPGVTSFAVAGAVWSLRIAHIDSISNVVPRIVGARLLRESPMTARPIRGLQAGGRPDG